LESIADKEVGGVNPKIPEMKENIRPASARPDKPETTAVAGFQSTNRHELLARLGKSPSIGKIGYASKSTVMWITQAPAARLGRR